MTLAAGAVHLAQVGAHTDEDPRFGLFFGIVGALQIMGGLYVARPVGSPRLVPLFFSFGIVGSLATVGIWAASRSFGLPFGAEPGEREEVGLADAAADLFEIFTVVLLVMWLRATGRAGIRWVPWAAAGSALAAVAAGAWVALRTWQIFDPDPRLVLTPELTDTAAVGFLLVVSIFFARLTRRPEGRLRRFGGLAVISPLLAFQALLVAFTVPARGGQNVDCAYAPIGEDSRLSHARSLDPIELAMGERRSVVVLLLVACADGPVELVTVTPLGPRGDGIAIDSVSVDRTRTNRIDRVRDAPGPMAVPLSGLRMVPGAGRYPVTIEVRAVAPGQLDLSALRVDYLFKGQPDHFSFASLTAFCVGDIPCGRR